jgi:hypothetical protein
MAVYPIKRLPARTAGPTLFGPQTSSVSLLKNDLSTGRSAAKSAAQKSEPSTASTEILRARDLLRDLLLREDETEDAVLVGQVSSGLNEIVCTLDNLAGLQHLFEVWSG